MKRNRIAPFAIAISAATVLLSACAPATAERPRVELPQNFRLPQNDMVKAFEPRIGRIAIAGEDGNILVMDQTGENIVQITKDAGSSAASSGAGGMANSYSLPVFSPSGQQIALVEMTAKSTPISSTIEVNPDAVIIQRGENSGVVENGPNGQVVVTAEPGMRVERQPSRVIIERGDGGGELVSSALYLASTDGKRPLREIFSSDAHGITYIDWAPDNSRLAFLAADAQGQQAELKLIEARDGARAKSIFDGTDVAWHWQPDSQSILAHVGASSDAGRLNIFDIAGDKATRVKGASGLAFNAPQFSPDGGYMLLTEPAGDGKHKLVLADRNGNKVKDLTDFEGDSISFAWSPRGAKVAYIVRSAGQPGSPLTVLDVNSGDKQVVTDHPVVTFFWSPDGQRIASFSLANRTDIPQDFPGFTVVPELNTPLMLLETLDPANGNARPLFYFAPTDQFLRLASEFDRYSRAVNIWSPDSRKLVFPLMFGDQNGTRDYVIETEASGSLYPRVIGNGGLAFWSPK